MRHVMVDIESLGTRPGSVIISIGAVVFDRERLHATFYRNVDVLSSLLAGLTVDEETCRWWGTQEPKALGPLQSNRLSLPEALDEFSSFVKKDDRIWAKGPDFDLVMLHEVYRVLHREIPWNFRNARDVRTILALAATEGDPASRQWAEQAAASFKGIKHFALDDAKKQALQVIDAHRTLGKGSLE